MPWKSSCSARTSSSGTIDDISGEYRAPNTRLATSVASTRSVSATPVRGCTSRTDGGSGSSLANRARTRLARSGYVAAQPRSAAQSAEQAIEGALRVPRKVERQAHVGRCHAVEHERADALAVLPQVDEPGPRPVRAAVDVDPLVAEERPDLVEVVHRDRGGVEARVGVVAGQALLQPLEADLVRLVEHGESVIVGLALQRIRPAGAALVDEHDVAIGLEPPEQLADLPRDLRCALSGTAREKEERIRPRVGAERRPDHDLERDAAAGSGDAVLEHVDGGRRVRRSDRRHSGRATGGRSRFVAARRCTPRGRGTTRRARREDVGRGSKERTRAPF